MSEKEIRLEGIDPREFYGPANVNLNEIVFLSPKVKVIARGSTVKVLGDGGEVDRFERRLRSLADYYLKYHHISREVVRQAFGSVGGRNDDGNAHGALFIPLFRRTNHNLSV